MLFDIDSGCLKYFCTIIFMFDILTYFCVIYFTKAMNLGLGANPVGPAGTGKTECVKSMGSMLGRHVLVFNCDEVF